MKTSIWGPSAWRFLHAVTFAYPETPSAEHKEAARALFTNLKLLLPCEDCCAHYSKALANANLEDALESKTKLTRWLFDFHNQVNARLGKPEFSWEHLVVEFQGEGTECMIEKSCGEEETQPKPHEQCASKLSSLPTIVAFLGLLFVIILIFSR